MKGGGNDAVNNASSYSAPSAASVTSTRGTAKNDGVVTDQTQTYTSNSAVAPTELTTRKTTETTFNR